MGEVIKLSKYRTEDERQRVAQRGYTRFQIRQYQKRQRETAEKRKDQEKQQE